MEGIVAQVPEASITQKSMMYRHTHALTQLHSSTHATMDTSQHNAGQSHIIELNYFLKLYGAYH